MTGLFTGFLRPWATAILAVCSAATVAGGEETEPYAPVAMTAPEYPSALQPGFEAVVHCLMVVDAQGSVREIADMVGVTKTGASEKAGVPEEFRRAVEKAVRQWRYPPSGGQREVAVTFQFLFRADQEMTGAARFVVPNFVQVFARRTVRDVRQ